MHPSFHQNILELTAANNDWRRVVDTNKHCQLVLMAIPPNEEIGYESHAVDQVLVFVTGHGSATIGDGPKFSIGPGDAVVVPAGTAHNFVNGPDGVMKLYTIYAPAEHPHGTVHHTKGDAVKDESVE